MTSTLLGATPALNAPLGGLAIDGELEAVTERLRRVTARVHTRGRGAFSGVGAGVVWSADGLLVTNAHVVAGRRGEWPVVQLADGRAFEARLAARNPERDLAVLALEHSGQPFEAALLGDARSLRVGELLLAVGHPFGVHASLSLGVVHAVRRGDDPWLRADIRLAPGNSGGPLATLSGAVVGINSMIVRGLGVAIPTHAVTNFVAEVLGRVGPTRTARSHGDFGQT
jgi:serine protease Do